MKKKQEKGENNSAVPRGGGFPKKKKFTEAKFRNLIFFFSDFFFQFEGGTALCFWGDRRGYFCSFLRFFCPKDKFLFGF